MSVELNTLEQMVERKMALLAALPAESLDAEALQRTQWAVAAENERLLRQRRLLRWTRGGLGAAASILLAVAWVLSVGTPPAPVGGDVEAVLSDWTAALNESTDRLASLREVVVTGEAGDEIGGELDELFNSLDETLERFESL